MRLAETLTHGCDLEACSQPTMLRRVHRLLAPDESYLAFMTGIVRSADARARATARLQALEPLTGPATAGLPCAKPPLATPWT